MGIWLIVLGVVVWVLFSVLKRGRANGAAKNNGNSKIVACSVCDVHIPESEAIFQHGKVFCSKEHLS